MLFLTMSIFCKYRFYHFKQKGTRAKLNRVYVPITLQIGKKKPLILIGCCYNTLFLLLPFFHPFLFLPWEQDWWGENCYIIYSSFPVFKYGAVTGRIQNICEHLSSQKQNCYEHLQPVLARFKPYTTSRKVNSGSQVGKLKKDIQ